MTTATSTIVRTTYVGPRDTPTGRTIGSRIRVQYSDGARKITRHVPLDFRASDPHKAAVQSLFPAPRSVVYKDWHNSFANESGTRQAWRVITLPEGLTATVEQDGGEGHTFQFAHWETPEDIAAGRAEAWPNYRYTVTFAFAPTGRNMEVAYATGTGWDVPPTGPEVLDGYVREAAYVEEFGLPASGPIPLATVQEFARGFGLDFETGDYDTDRRALRDARRMLTGCRKIDGQLRRLFGDYDAAIRAEVEGWEL